ncbi:D-alanine--D-alanine ligase family protein [Thermosediminibacter oceani]|uniref:D-alanine--D-alanine ligase n=1 Tax=Thermosediminibacter oceani (strain ATCC BAA-1034 / DSM 16646 / JW/IW-1228P) TaxID=555079 RepID=D9S1G6_THEOJ|nr:ATP-grasp domain-containing protein [Thermosediminibacter oceani]ADL07243.1 D-alanine--D-alanine ligase [Thermosediminibacter oceani DSM 16646]
MKVGVFWRKFRNVELQLKLSGENIYDDAYEEAYQHFSAIKEAGFDAVMIEWKKDNPQETLRKVLEEKVDLVFNASSLEEVAFLEAFGIPFAGSGLDLVATDKATRKKIVAYHKLPTPRFIVVEDPNEIPDHDLKYPLFVKPVRGRGSAGISEENIIERHEDLARVVSKITDKIGQPALVEEFIRGREITVGIIGYKNPRVLPPVEIEYNSTRTNTFEHKMFDNEIIHCPARLSPEEEEKVKSTALSIYKVLNAKDFSRIDMILGDDGIPYFLEINTFAGLTMSKDGTHHGYMGYMAKTAGMTRADFIGSIVRSALERYRICHKL